MNRRFRVLRRWKGPVASPFLMTPAVTGTRLATKKTTGWVRPPSPEADGTKIAKLAEAVSVNRAAQAAFDLGIPELQGVKHLDRIDSRP